MDLAALKSDYLFIAPLLRAQLQAALPGIPCEVVETAEQVLAADRRERVLLVMWAGERFTGRAGRNQLLVQRWLVILALNNVGKQADARQTTAGPVLSQVHAAVVGWVPTGAVNAMERANADMRPDVRKDKALYPLGFQIELSL